MDSEKELYEALTHDQKDALDWYKSNNDLEGQFFCYEINRKLNQGEELTGKWLELSKSLDSAISSVRCKDEFTIYRACFLHDIEKHIAGNILAYPAYMSAAREVEAISRHYATPFNNVTPILLEILVTKTQTYFPMEGKESFGGHEREVLLPRNTVLKIVNDCVLKEHNLDYGVALGQYAEKFSELRKLRARCINA